MSKVRNTIKVNSFVGWGKVL
jgi:hypothetical protein